MGDYRVHLGVDIEANLGDPVYSCADGFVSQITEDPFMGVSVAISHSNGYVSFYKNLAPELAPGIKEGMAVTAGQIIGTVGETAAVEIADSSHLHFELTVDGVCVNPEDYIDFPQTAQTSAANCCTKADRQFCSGLLPAFFILQFGLSLRYRQSPAPSPSMQTSGKAAGLSPLSHNGFVLSVNYDRNNQLPPHIRHNRI